MLGGKQAAAMMGVGLLLWLGVALAIRAAPETALDPILSAWLFAAAIPAGLASVWLAKAAGRLRTDQLATGVALAGAVAMMIDGAAIRWAPGVYGASERALLFTSGWLLWSYGAAFAAAVVWAAIETRRS